MARLTPMDLKQLLSEPSPQARGVLASKIAQDFRDSQFNESESAIAVDIFRMLMKESEIKIRQALAEQLAHCANAPHDIIWRLANDEESVSLPILEHSLVLTEDDLVSIIQSTHEVLKLCAIASREEIPEDVSGSLLKTSNTAVMHKLLNNKGAILNERQLMKSWEKIMSSASLLETLVHRGSLPVIIAEKLFLAVSDDLKQHLSKQYNLDKTQLNKAVDDVREWTLLGITPQNELADPSDDDMVEDLVNDLHSKGRLTHSLVLRSLCVGNLKIFETGLARMARIPRVNARILLMESSGMGLRAIYAAARMPEGFYDAVRILLRICLEETEFGKTRRTDFRKRVIDRIYIEKYNSTVENMEYILSIIGGKTVAAANVH